MYRFDRGFVIVGILMGETAVCSCLTPVERMSGILVYMLWLRNLRVWENHRFGIVPYMYALVGHWSGVSFGSMPCHPTAGGPTRVPI